MEDGDKVLKDFVSILEDLTFNSRPIITSLTKMAEENISYAQQFVDAVESRIAKCVPNQKLYAFYALDSICKNAGSPYTIYFSRNLAKIYRQTYLIVDNATRTKLILMFKTWMTPLPTGELLFDKDTLDRIEQFLIKASSLHQRQAQAMAPPPTVPQLLRDIDKLTSMTQERLGKEPSDSKLQSKIIVLQQLKHALQKERLPLQALHQVQQQLRHIFAQEQQVLWHQQHKEQQLRKMAQQQMQVSAPVFEHSAPPMSHSFEGSSLFGNATLSMSFLDSISSSNGSAGSQCSNKVSKVESIYRTLKQHRMLHEPGEQSVVKLASLLEKSMGPADNMQLPPFSLLQDILGNVRAHYAVRNIDILNTPNLQLSQQFVMQKNNPLTEQLMHLLYRSKPNKCTSCGVRFGTSQTEHQMEIDHFDWHFRINKRIKGTQSNSQVIAKNIQSRTWYLNDEQWILFKDEDIVSTNTNNPAINTVALAMSQTTTASESENKAKNELQIRKKYVVVPDGVSDMSFQCSICTEVTSAVYDEDLSEWVWRNCVGSNGKYFHATCFEEASKSTADSGGASTGIDSDLERLKGLVNSNNSNAE
ncbi:AGR190Cp [Eremothecium gossypii ATCC 10895]|uniref:AGR190Cp n=1 Tax=Eremothecium gossypii (strain ATCC 10895 / CBS 109.51 / FGSC 9923 / NRRL Y-1056) TaxID=284811 RepID=Q74ZL0_EREGS|nr:AGR190Cp [Eremothecium gossypii ATCC 10895]AAS54680.1 AGR190Cp [Eremothecium gossypii ATCC 10895]AEY99010.1 FAGR190Cp [Eremothecium gossypii FDAG1]